MKVKVKALRDIRLSEFGVDVEEGETVELDVTDSQLENLHNTHVIEVLGGEKPAKKEKKEKKEVE